MGGSAFSAGPDPLPTPRMPRAVYETVRDATHARLAHLFWAVATPIEGPGKTDFGDIDVVVALPRADRATEELVGDVVAALGAVRAIVRPDKTLCAVPYPDTPGQFVQIDVAVLPSLARFHWALFKDTHGDLWNILGSAVLRPLGLTIDDTALWLRVPSIETHHRARSKIFLTDDPHAVLAFLALDHAPWDAPFPDATTLFRYCATSRFFVLPDETALRDAFNRNARRRLAQRPLFRRWLDEFVPAFVEGPFLEGHEKNASRESVRDAAFAFFPGTRSVYTRREHVWHREHHLMAIRNAIKAAVPADLPGPLRGEVCAALRRYLGLVMAEAKTKEASDDDDDDGGDGKDPAADHAMQWTVDSVTEHVQQIWPALAADAWPTLYAQYQQSCKT